jgi:hypothetical protein
MAMELQNLQEAIVTATAFTLPYKSKTHTPTSGIRLLPRTEAAPARVFATRGTASILIDVEGDLPNLVVDAVGVEAAIRADPAAVVEIKNMLVHVGKYSFQPWCAVEAFPGFPQVPAAECFQRIPYAGLIDQVLHVLGKDPEYPEFHNVSFRPGVAEATDTVRLARVPLAVNRTVQVHGDVFANWRSGTVEWAVEGGIGAVFRWPGEIRWGQVYEQGVARPYPDLSGVRDVRPDEHDIVVSVSELRKALKKATGTSTIKTVRCYFRPGELEVEGVIDQMAPGKTIYRAKVPALCQIEAQCMLNGMAFVSALDVLGTPRAMLGFSSRENEPLKVRGGAYLEFIWPILLV